jgi:hypothetical protein
MKEVSVMITRKNRSLKAAIVAAVFLLAGFAAPGLSLASIGGFEISNALTQNLEADHFNSGYHYYALTDPRYPHDPYAIVGVEKGYRISGPYWESINPDSPGFASMANLVEQSPIWGSSTYGAYILDSQNRQIGTWYSSYMADEVVNNPAKTVSVTINHNWLLN